MQSDMQTPVDNGGRTEKYIWTQTQNQVTIYIFIAKELTKKDIKVNIQQKRLKVTVRGKTEIDGQLYRPINVDESSWYIQQQKIQQKQGKCIKISLQKPSTSPQWWLSAILNHPQINPQQLPPLPLSLPQSNQNNNTLTHFSEQQRNYQKRMQLLQSKQYRQNIEKEMKRKMQLLKEFMRCHPQMDFSKCKFN